MYQYQATVVRWVDGDTVWLDVDLGFRLTARIDFRLEGVNTPERGQPGYTEATAFASGACPPGSVFTINTTRPDKYGRWLVNIHLPDGQTISQALIAAGLGVPYNGGPRLEEQ